jgi:DNA-binding NtrC family response regulator
MANPTRDVQFLDIELGKKFRFPAPWQGTEPAWLRNHGRTIVAVVDDQLQRASQLDTPKLLQKQILDPLNVEFQFFEECEEHHPAARGRKWFEPVAKRLAEMRDKLAIVLLDIMFVDDSIALSGAGLEFLKYLYEEKTVGAVPVMMITQAREEEQLQRAIADAGMSCQFLRKEPDKWLDVLTASLCKYGWLSDPTFGAYSPAMRKELAKLRRYAINQPYHTLTDGAKMPYPLLFSAPSGEGKTWTATRAANWLLNCEPKLRKRNHLEQLDCNALGDDQSARIKLFGRGPLTPQGGGDRRPDAGGERPDRSGLVERGAAQQAADAVLLIEELGNSTHKFQNYLITFVETGRASPEFATKAMTTEALGPLDVLCVYTVQPAHVAEGKITPDMDRRFKRGEHFEIPPLHERWQDIVPVFYERLKNFRRQQDSYWLEPDNIDELILRNAQDFLVEEVVSKRLSSSFTADLVGQPGPKVVIGIPYLIYHLGERMRLVSQRVTHVPQQPGMVVGAAPVSDVADVNDIRSILRGAAEVGRNAFPKNVDDLQGLRPSVYQAVTNLLLRFLEAGLNAHLAPPNRTKIDVTNAGRFLFDGLIDPTKLLPIAIAKNPQAETKLAGLIPLELDRQFVLNALRESDLLAQLAIEIAEAKRSKPIEAALQELAKERSQATRLQQLGWSCAVSPATP